MNSKDHADLKDAEEQAPNLESQENPSMGNNTPEEKPEEIEDVKEGTEDTNKEAMADVEDANTPSVKQESEKSQEPENRGSSSGEHDIDDNEEKIKTSVSANKSVEAEGKDDDDMEEDEDEEPDKGAEDGPIINHTKQTHTIVIPSYASWFNMKKIHPIEKESLPEFFNSVHPSKSPKIYVNYRNFMINSYRLNPNEYLTLTSCRRNLVGDVGTLMRVHRFLNKWGLINYQVHSSFKPGYAIDKMPNGMPANLPYTGDFHVTYDTPRGLFPFNTHKFRADEVDVTKLKLLMHSEEKDRRSTGQHSSANDKLEQENQVECNGTEKRQSIDMEQEDTKQDNPIKKRRMDSWTPKEISKLILAIKENRNDWYAISKAVGTRSPQECILKFLKLPIEDEFNDVSEKGLGIMRFASNFPVNSTENPVLSNLIFMTQLVDSEVAKAASMRASKVMDEKILEKIKDVYGEGSEEKSNDTKKKDEASQPSIKTDEEAAVRDEKSANSKDSADMDLAQDSVTNDAPKAIINDESNHKEIELDIQSKIDSSKPSPEHEEDEENVKLKEQEVSQLVREEFDVKHGASNNLRDAAANAFGIVGARGHLFATYEEREMNKVASTILNNQINKLDLKLSKISDLEKAYEKERQYLARQQEELFVDRIALTNSTINITKKLNEAISIIKQASGIESNSESLKTATSILSEVQSLLYKPTRYFMTTSPSKHPQSENGARSNGEYSSGEKDSSNSDMHKKSNNNETSDPLRPISLDSPHSFKIWVP